MISAKKNDDFAAKMKDFQTAHAVNDDTENPSIVKYDEEALKKVKPISRSTNR